MSEDRDDIPLEKKKPQFIWNEIRSLIEILQNLHLQISSKILEKRMQPTNPAGTRKQNVDIAGSLKDYIDTNLNDQSGKKGIPEKPQEQ
jgi:hypothetical protein